MKTHKILKACVSMWVIILSVIFYTPNAFPWGSATHAYIDNKIGKKLPFQNLNEIYGGMAADIFNFYPDVLVPGTAYFNLYIQTHYNSLELWSKAQTSALTNLGKASAFGFVSHANGQFNSSYAGADYTAHGPMGNDYGYYVIDRAKVFWAILKPQLPNGLILDDLQGEAISHNIIEFAIDIMVAYEMPGGIGIGRKIMESALLRTPEFPLLLVKAYASDTEAKVKIISAERDFRKTILTYGQALNQKKESDAINAVAELLAQLALDIYNIQVTPDLVATSITGAQNLCRPDYATAINDTIGFVNTKMAVAGIHY
jgi:hypothetical protein